jgi:hypothetical protein
MSQVFPMIDRQFNPVYSRKVLEALIAKSGGTLQSVQKFHSNRDESLAYYRAKLTAEIEPKEPEYKPKRCVLVPFHLIKGFTDDWKSPTPPDDPMGEPVTSPVTSVTPSYTQLHEKCNQQNVDPELDSAIVDSLVTSFSEKSTKQNQQQVEEAVTDVLGQEQNSHTLVLGKDVTEENLEAVALIPAESERLHISCNQTVTGCNQTEKNVTELVEKKVDTITTTPDVQPEAIAPLPLVEIEPQATKAAVDDQTSQLLKQDTVGTATQVEEEMQLHTFKVGDRVSPKPETSAYRLLEKLVDYEVYNTVNPRSNPQSTLLYVRPVGSSDTMCPVFPVEDFELIQFAVPQDDCLFKVGDRVDWDSCPGSMSGQGPFVIQEIEGATAKLEYFVPRAPLSELRLTK